MARGRASPHLRARPGLAGSQSGGAGLIGEAASTRRALFTGAAAATAAGAAVAGAGGGLLSAPSSTVASPTTPGVSAQSGQVFVSANGSDRNNGASWSSALATIARALEVVGNGTV